MTQVWIEKYRPYYLKDVEGDTQTLQRLKNIAREGNMPNLLIAVKSSYQERTFDITDKGPPGTGKTTSILALARELLGDRFNDAVMELNASDDRGIDVVRDKIKTFAKRKIDLPPMKHKIIILDEADAMTEAAQQAMRRLMEVHSDTTRFALACNQSTKIIEPIQSRCAIIRYSRLQDSHILHRLLVICKKEKVDYVDSGLETLLFTAEGDMRNAINNLQSTVSGFGLVNKENVIKVCDMPPPEIIQSVIDWCLKAVWREAHASARSLLSQGYTPNDIVVVMKSVLRRSKICEVVCLEYLKMVSRYHFMMIDGVSSPLQLDALLAQLCHIAIEMQQSKLMSS